MYFEHIPLIKPFKDSLEEKNAYNKTTLKEFL